MKAMLVIEMPKNCEGCPLHHSVLDEVLDEWFVNCQLDTFIDEDKKRPSQCPLRPLPSKLVPFGYLDAGNEDGLYEKGYNDCIDEITGETE